VEIRLNANAAQPLATKVFFCDEEGFEVASVIVTGKSDAVLIDAQWTLSGAHRVITEIVETGKKLTTIPITTSGRARSPRPSPKRGWWRYRRKRT
jgi:hypothetical protein